MNTNLLKTTALILTLFFSLHACKDDNKPPEEKPSTKPTNKELLTNKKWMLTESYVYPKMYDDIVGDSTNDIYSMIAECQKDDWGIYLQDSIYEYHTGELKCSPQIPDIHYSKWFLNETMDSLTILSGANSATIFIDSISHDYLRTKNVQFIPARHEFMEVFRIKED